MSIKNMFSSRGVLIFPIAVLLVYWAQMYYEGRDIHVPIRGATTFAILAVMIVLELAFRYEKAASQKRLVWRDITSTLVNLWLTGSIMGAIFAPVVLFLPEVFFGRTLFFSTSDQLGPFWLQLILVIFSYSLMKYSIHRLQHRVGFLWKLHAYHHSVTDLRASNTFVSHPLDFAFRNVLPPIVLGVIGFDPTAIVFGAGILGVTGTMSHCGAGLHAGWLNHIFVTPELHRWHHSAETPKGHKYSVNYGVGFILWDRIFGTYYLPLKDGVPVQPDSLGHPDGVADESNYFRLFFLTRYLPAFLRPAKS
jgi:sterol desaturase/sphingolipid hydroxylase (fatty acid hydroxylase superfamily)